MLHLIKRITKKIIRQTGYSLSKIDKYQYSLEKVKYNWLKKKNIKTIIDVGACDGDFIRKFRPVFPDAMIYSIEPNPESFEKLNAFYKNDPKIKPFNIALSNFKSDVDFFVSESAGSSSLLEMEEIHKINFPLSAKNERIKVKCDLLDNIFSNIILESNVLMKLDVQGAEKLVLEGSIKTLKSVDVILCEVNFQELYKHAVLATDLIQFLKINNFIFFGIENMHQSLIDGTYTHGDAFFIKEKK